MPGGRPRNNWTATKERKLARLYCLTNLEINEIQVVLKADGFGPRQDTKLSGLIYSTTE
jgi:hypothetical protein